MIEFNMVEGEVLECIENYGTHAVAFMESGLYTVFEAKVQNGFPFIENCTQVPPEIQEKIKQHQELESYQWSEV